MSLKRNHRLYCCFLKVLIPAFRNFIRPLCALKHLILPLWILKHPAFRFYTRPPPLCARTSLCACTLMRICMHVCACARACVCAETASPYPAGARAAMLAPVLPRSAELPGGGLVLVSSCIVPAFIKLSKGSFRTLQSEELKPKQQGR